MLDLLRKRHSQAGLRMPFHNISPLGNEAQTSVFQKDFWAKQGHLRSRMSDVFSQSRASSLAKGFGGTAPAWLAQAQPCSFIRVNPSYPWFLPYESAANDFARKESREILKIVPRLGSVPHIVIMKLGCVFFLRW
jgi:hypothetical protein